MTKDRLIEKEIEVAAVPGKVWEKWTTEAGLKSFFPPECRVDLRVGGAFEMYFMVEGAPGTRGSEGCTFLAIEPYSMLSFTWNAPPHLPNVRKQFTTVTLRFEEIAEAKTKLSLRHYGWGETEEWTQAYNYFSAAWDRVLESLRAQF